jgi:hypothetical protein
MRSEDCRFLEEPATAQGRVDRDIFRKQMTGVEMNSAACVKILKNEKGLAMLETIPLIVIFAMLVGFGLGFFGIIHTAILHSIGARTYAYETFRNRANLYYFREDGTGLERPINYTKKQWRYHAVQHENDSRTRFVATTRGISFGRDVAANQTTSETHNVQIFQLPARNDRVAVNPAWIMVGYGICLNATCGNN